MACLRPAHGLHCILASTLLLAYTLPLLAQGQGVAPQAGALLDKANFSQIITLAPAVAPINGINDISQEGNCAAELKAHCQNISPGDGRLAECLSDRISESETPEGSDSISISDACREEVYQFKIQRSGNINYNVELAKACKVDAEKHCNQSWLFSYQAGQVIACLRDVSIREELAPACKKLISKVQADAAEDYRADPALHEACKADVEHLCPDVKPGGGRVQACLRDKRPLLSWPCEAQLFRQEEENTDDVRLSVRLFAKCMPDKKRFCADVEPGAARVKDCLEQHRKHAAFSPGCKEEVDAMVERRVHDFRLDSRLRSVCRNVIQEQCSFYMGDLGVENSFDGSIIRCLQDYVGEIKDDACKKQVTKYKELAAEDVRFDVPLADACYKDRQSFCSNVPPGSARVIRCLMKQRVKLSPRCRAVLFDEEVRFSANIDFQYPLKQACQQELALFCKDVPHGEARAIRCLQDHKADKEMGKDCKEQIQEFEKEASSDYRFNYRLSNACKSDIDNLCAGVCKAEEGQVCGGAVLRCLIEKREQLTGEQCKHEVFYFEKMEVTDYRNDLILAAACRADVEKFCAKVEPGEGRVHECLRSHRQELSPECSKEELLLEVLEAENVELKPGVMRVCKDERLTFCKGVVPGSARMFRCLAEKMGDVDFGEACRNEVTAKLQRRQANWKLDPMLRKACKGAVQELCSQEDSTMQEKGLVYKCLVRNYEDLDPPCQKELGRALHMAFFIWQPAQLLTHECDSDIMDQCLALRPNMNRSPGAVGQCLATILEEMSSQPEAPSSSVTSTVTSVDIDGEVIDAQPAPLNPRARRSLSAECRVLVDIAQPPDMKKAFDASLSVLMLQSQLNGLQSVTGLKMLNTDRQGNVQGITLTGWTAVAGMAALLVLMLWGAGFAWKKYQGVPDAHNYTLVVKRSHR